MKDFDGTDLTEKLSEILESRIRLIAIKWVIEIFSDKPGGFYICRSLSGKIFESESRSVSFNLATESNIRYFKKMIIEKWSEELKEEPNNEN